MIRNKIKQGVAFGLLFATLITPTLSFAKTTQDVINKQPTSIYAPSSYKIDGINDDLLTPSNQSVPYQDYTKTTPEKTPLVKGGNLKAVNPLATKENRARGTVLENVDKNGKDITPTGDEKKDKDNPVDVRQFLTFQTKSGKTMHLIVDHSAKQENVRLLTEVGEQDLLNMIEPDEDAKKNKPIIKEEPIKKPEPVKKEEPKKETKKDSSSIFIIIFVIVGVIGVAYYLKVVKRKDQKAMEDFETEDDDEGESYISESEEAIDNDSQDETEENISEDDDDDEDLL